MQTHFCSSSSRALPHAARTLPHQLSCPRESFGDRMGSGPQEVWLSARFQSPIPHLLNGIKHLPSRHCGERCPKSAGRCQQGRAQCQGSSCFPHGRGVSRARVSAPLCPTALSCKGPCLPQILPLPQIMQTHCVCYCFCFLFHLLFFFFSFCSHSPVPLPSP